MFLCFYHQFTFVFLTLILKLLSLRVQIIYLHFLHVNLFMLLLEHSLHDELPGTQIANTPPRSLLLFNSVTLGFSDLILRCIVYLTTENTRLRQTFLAVTFRAEITVMHFFVGVFAQRLERRRAREAVFGGLFGLLRLLG